MGASHNHRLTTAPLALALLLALATTTSSSSTSTAGDVTSGAGAAPAAAEQSAASLTSDAEVSTAASELAEAAPEPAVRVAATGDLADPITRVQVPNVLLAAYRSAAAGVPDACNLPVSLLAAIGEVESGSLVGRELDSRHRTSILGPVLDGNGFAAVADTDGGKWDGDAKWDRAMGPMQFIPGTWRLFGVDGDGDGVADPQDVEDASAATAAYLCYGGRDLSQPSDLGSAILAYNHSTSYQQLVLTYQRRYASLGLDRGESVTGVSTPVSLVTMESLGAVQGPTRAARPAGSSNGHQATKHAKDTRHTQHIRHTKHTRPARPAGSGQSTKPVKTDEPSPTPTTATSQPPNAAATPTTAAPSASPAPSTSATPTPTDSATPTPTPSTTPTPSHSATPTPTPTHSPSPTPSGSPTVTAIPVDAQTGCPLVEDPAEGAVDSQGVPCLPCVPNADPSSEGTLAADGREIACTVEKPTR